VVVESTGRFTSWVCRTSRARFFPRSGETKTPEYTALNARQKIPLLVDGDFRIGESAAIVAYLSQNYSTPEHALIPEEKSLQAKWLEWCIFIVAELDSTSLYVCAATA